MGELRGFESSDGEERRRVMKSGIQATGGNGELPIALVRLNVAVYRAVSWATHLF